MQAKPGALGTDEKRGKPMKFRYPMLFVFFALFLLFAGYVFLESQGVSVPDNVFAGLLLVLLVTYAYLWQKKWKEDRERMLEQMKMKEQKKEMNFKKK